MNLLTIFGILFFLLIIIVAVIFSFYVMVYYSHTLEKSYPGVNIARALIVTGMTISVMMPFLLAFDFLSVNSSQFKYAKSKYSFNLNLYSFWRIITIVILVIYFIN